MKEERVRNSKRKKLEVDNSDEPISNQPKIGDVIAPPYSPEHPRQQALTNAIAQMICVDAMLEDEKGSQTAGPKIVIFCQNTLNA